jgi:hypothetical protein
MISFLQFKYDGELAYIVITIVNILVYSSVFVCNWKSLKGFKKKDNDIEEVTHIISIVINHIMMFIGFLAIYVTDSEPWHYAIIIALSGACFIGTNNLLRKYKDTKWIGFYVGIKATIYLNTIFYSFEYLSEHSYFSSITSLALAVVAILIGFKLQTKSLRVYGLALSMLSIFKLLLIDIQYDNSIGRVLSFIFAGILCFGINYVYNMASKKINK